MKGSSHAFSLPSTYCRDWLDRVLCLAISSRILVKVKPSSCSIRFKILSDNQNCRKKKKIKQLCELDSSVFKIADWLYTSGSPLLSRPWTNKNQYEADELFAFRCDKSKGANLTGRLECNIDGCCWFYSDLATGC